MFVSLSFCSSEASPLLQTLNWAVSHPVLGQMFISVFAFFIALIIRYLPLWGWLGFTPFHLPSGFTRPWRRRGDGTGLGVWRLGQKRRWKESSHVEAWPVVPAAATWGLAGLPFSVTTGLCRSCPFCLLSSPFPGLGHLGVSSMHGEPLQWAASAVARYPLWFVGD